MLRFDHSVPTKNRLSSLLSRVLVGAAAALGLTGVMNASASPNTFSCDVVVVGAGGAGLSAALSASEAGADVLVIEKMPMLGGNTVLSASHMLSPPKNDRGAEARLESIVQAKGGSTADPALARMIIGHAAETLDWLSGMGADFIRFTPTVVGVPLPDQGIRPKGGRVIGEEIIKTLLHGAEVRRVPIQTLSSVTGITQDADGRISGVEVLNAQGRVWQVKAKAVLLATGGFAASDDMVRRHTALPDTMQSTNSPGCTGDGIVMAQSFGARTIDMDAVTVHPTTLPFSGLVIPLQTRVLGAILVNERGERFADELSPGLRAEIEKQPGGRAWMIFDQKILKSMPVLSKFARNGYFLKGSTEEELARRMQISPQKLFQQISIYRSYVRKRHDEDFGRKTLPSLLFSYPLYAVSVSPGIHNTPGGLCVDEKGRVLSPDGPVPGLYAAGEVTGGIFGRSRPEGMGLTGALVHGRLTGRAAAEWALGRTR
ncbi:MAG: flavocytochrome c [Sutterella sp.]|nr:flavocytochrome c [Sutterella sp.]